MIPLPCHSLNSLDNPMACSWKMKPRGFARILGLLKALVEEEREEEGREEEEEDQNDA